MPIDAAHAARLLESGLALSSELALDILLQRTVELATELTGARYAALGVIQDGHLVDFLTTGLSPEERGSIGELPMGRGILGALIDTARPLRLRDIADDPRSVGFPSNHPPMSSFLGAPIRAVGRVFGNLYLTEKEGGGEFTAEDEEALVVLASQAGVAIANATLYSEARLRERWLEAVRETGNEILSGEDTEEILTRMARRARDLSSADQTTVLTPTSDGDHMEVTVAVGAHASELMGMRIPIAGSVSGAVYREGRTRHLADPAGAEDAYAPMISAGRMGPSIFVPLTAQEHVFGILSVSRARDRRDFREADVTLLESYAGQAALALEYGRVQRDLQRLALVEDRERIAKELHDGVIQALFAVGLGLQGTSAMISEPRVADRLQQAVAEIDAVIGDLRSYIFGLRPGILAGAGLAAALERLCVDAERRTGVTTVLDVDSGVEVALASVERDVVQLVREALSNVGRHAQATTCRVSLRREGSDALLEVDDDGRGFDVGASRTGMGLGNLHGRAERLGGELVVDSVPGQGTTIRVRLPLETVDGRRQVEGRVGG